MTPYEELLAKVPIRHNWESLIMILGIVQSFFICLVIAVRSNSENQSLRIFGWLNLILCLISLDVYLCYTGLIKHAIYLNDSTEFLVLLIGPLFYFFFRSILKREGIRLKKDWVHFVLPFIYFVFQWPAMLQSNAFKLNAYVGAFYPEFPKLTLEYDYLWNYFFFRDNDRWFNLFSLILYLVLSIRLMKGIWKEKNLGVWMLNNRDKYQFSRNTLLSFILVGILILAVYLNYENDLGDHFIIIFFSLSTFATSFFMLSESRLFQKSWIAEKYETSGLQSNQEKILTEVKHLMEEEQYYLQTSVSLKELAEKLELAPNYLSQSINTLCGQNFNEFINSYRIEEAKSRLLAKDYEHLSIEGIGNGVGFRSKSAFYKAFKKHTEMTPAVFVKKHR